MASGLRSTSEVMSRVAGFLAAAFFVLLVFVLDVFVLLVFLLDVFFTAMRFPPRGVRVRRYMSTAATRGRRAGWMSAAAAARSVPGIG